MDVAKIETMEPRVHAVEAPAPEDHSEVRRPHDELSSKLEQQIKLIATCFRLKEPQRGFSPSEWLVLSALANVSECGLKPLAQEVCISSGTTSKIVRRLQMMRLIEWKRSSTERRSYALSITELGMKTYRQTRLSAIRNTATCFAPLTVEQLEQVTSLLYLCMPAGRFNY